MTTSNIKRKVYRDNDRYVCRLEEMDNILFVHIEVKGEINTSLIKELRREFKEFKIKIRQAGYDYLYSYSATPKFYSLFKGYEDIGHMDWDGKEYRVLRWVLN